jgi:hypothetical protein
MKKNFLNLVFILLGSHVLSQHNNALLFSASAGFSKPVGHFKSDRYTFSNRGNYASIRVGYLLRNFQICTEFGIQSFQPSADALRYYTDNVIDGGAPPNATRTYVLNNLRESYIMAGPGLSFKTQKLYFSPTLKFGIFSNRQGEISCMLNNDGSRLYGNLQAPKKSFFGFKFGVDAGYHITKVLIIAIAIERLQTSNELQTFKYRTNNGKTPQATNQQKVVALSIGLSMLYKFESGNK